MSEQKRLLRNTTDRVLGGVTGGIARYFEIDRTFVRLAFAMLALFNGIGLAIYFLMWLAVPGDNSGDLTGEATVRANIEDMRAQARKLVGERWSATSGASLIGIVLVAIGVIYLIHAFVPSIPPGIIWPIVLIGVGAYLLFGRR